MRVLHLTTELPHPTKGSGGATRQFYLLSRLAELGHYVSVVSPVSEHQLEDWAPHEVLAAAGIQLAGTPRAKSRAREVGSAARRRPTVLLRAASLPLYPFQTDLLLTGMASAIDAQLDKGPDVVVIEHDFAMGLGRRVPGVIPQVLTLHNVTSDYYATRARQARGVRALGLRRQARLSGKHFEANVLRFERLIAVSSADAALVHGMTEIPVDVIPNGTRIDDAAPLESSTSTAEPGHVLFTGTMNHPPNEEGILWFCEQIWPRVLAEVPSARLMIVGRNPTSAVTQLAARDASVTVTGDVPDMKPYQRAATVTVAPLLSGGGTRLKILDALAAGSPVVATRQGAAGIELQDGIHALLADEPDDFATRTVQLLRDGSLRGRIASAGYELVASRYGWDALGDQLEKTLICAHSGQG